MLPLIASCGSPYQTWKRNQLTLQFTRSGNDTCMDWGGRPRDCRRVPRWRTWANKRAATHQDHTVRIEWRPRTLQRQDREISSRVRFQISVGRVTDESCSANIQVGVFHVFDDLK